MARRFLYVADPMCSWCWGFRPAIDAARAALADDVEVRFVMGGLARDSDEPMPEETRRYVQGAWDAVEAATGAEFNRDFWTRCEPRRSTYPACRAVIAGGLQGDAEAMFAAIQRAYYLEARNPSDAETLIAVARERGLDADRFAADLASPAVDALLHEDFAVRAALGVTSFPSTALAVDGAAAVLTRGWVPADELLRALRDRGATS